MKIFLRFIFCFLFLNCSTNNLDITKFYNKEKHVAFKKCKINEKKFIKIAKENTLKENTLKENYNFFCEDELIKYDIFLRNTSQIIDSLGLESNYIIVNREYKSSFNGFLSYKTTLILTDSILRKKNMLFLMKIKREFNQMFLI